MNKGTATLVVDLGNSTTKLRVKYDKKWRECELSNNFSFLPLGYNPSSDYNESNSTIMSVDFNIGGRQLKGEICNGLLQAEEFFSRAMRPTAKQKKYESVESAMSLRLAFLQAYRELQAMLHTSTLEELEIVWNVVVLLPPEDLTDDTKSKMTSLVKSVTEINSVLPKFTTQVHTDKVLVLPEGFCAYAGVVYDKDNTFRKGYEYLTEETVIVFDIGAGTTDCLIIKDNRLVQNSKHTVDLGGNNVFALVKSAIALDGISISDEALRKGILNGFIKDGAKRVSIIDKVNNAKQEVAEKIINDFQTYLDKLDTKVRSIGYVIIAGGGAMRDTACDEIIPLSQFVYENFKIYSPNSELVKIPSHTISKEAEDGTLIKVEEVMSERFLNLYGASIFADKVFEGA